MSAAPPPRRRATRGGGEAGPPAAAETPRARLMRGHLRLFLSGSEPGPRALGQRVMPSKQEPETLRASRASPSPVKVDAAPAPG
jgi:hypothetical protein